MQVSREEFANSITHAVGAGLSIAALSILVSFAATKGDAWHIVSFSIYGSSLILLYFASTLYHGCQIPHIKEFFHLLDHSFIYLLIAGTYTPIALVSLRGAIGWVIFGIVWSVAILGIVIKIFFQGRFKKISVFTYVAMGWIVVMVLGPTIDAISWNGFWLLFAGGCSYSFGILFYSLEKMPYNHMVWHLFVIGGSVCHFLMMFLYVLP